MNGVLIIDDNPVDIMLQERVLKRCCRFGPIHSVSNGQDALDLLRNRNKHNELDGFPLALVLLDVNMPVLDGFGFVAQLCEQGELDADYKIVMLTSSNAESDRQRAVQFERIDRLMVKPLTPADALILAEHYLSPPEQQLSNN